MPLVDAMAAALGLPELRVVPTGGDQFKAEREQWGAQAEALFGGDDLRRLPHLRGLTLMLVAGVQYLLVRARKIRIFGGIDLSSDAGWSVLKASLRSMAQQLLAGDSSGASPGAGGPANGPVSPPQRPGMAPPLTRPLFDIRS